MKKDSTSEEKLLNLIRKKNPADKKDKTRTPSTNPAGRMPVAMGDLSDIPKTLSRGLMVLCLGLTFYIVMHVFLAKPPDDNLLSIDRTEASPEEASGAAEVLPEPRPFS